MNAILVDDEQLMLDELKYFLSQYPDIKIAVEFNHALKAIEYIKKLHEDGYFVPDVVFMDIDMPNINGLEVALSIQDVFPDIIIVFVTAYSSYALDSFKVHPLDYVLKPVKKSQFDATVERIRRQVKLLQDERRKKQKSIYITCFGHFEIFVSGTRVDIKWGTHRVKELFIYLIDRCGAEVTRNDHINEIFGGIDPDGAFLRLTEGFSLEIKPGVCDYIDFMCFAKNNGIINSHNADKAAAILKLYHSRYLEGHNSQWAIQTSNDAEIEYERISISVAAFYASKVCNETAENVLLDLIFRNPLADEAYTMLGTNDGSPLIIPGIDKPVEYEISFEGDEVPSFWQSADTDISPDVVSYGLVSGWDNTAADSDSKKEEKKVWISVVNPQQGKGRLDRQLHERSKNKPVYLPVPKPPKLTLVLKQGDTILPLNTGEANIDEYYSMGKDATLSLEADTPSSATVYFNDAQVYSGGTAGVHQCQLVLNEGENKVSVRATDSDGDFTDKAVRIISDSVPPLLLMDSTEIREEKGISIAVYRLDEQLGRWDYMGGTLEDVDSSRWSSSAVYSLVHRNIVEGVKIGTKHYYKPGTYITRAEFIKMLSAGLGTETSEDNVLLPFADKKAIPDWALKHVKAAFVNGWVNGRLVEGMKLIGANENITREEACAILGRMLGDSLKPKGVHFSDRGKVAKYAVDYLDILADMGVLSGYKDDSFKPQNLITREEAAAMIDRYLKNR